MEYIQIELPKAEYFRAMRAKYDLSAIQVSKEIGISHHTLLNLEKGNYAIKYQTIINLVKFYKEVNNENKQNR